VIIKEAEELACFTSAALKLTVVKLGFGEYSLIYDTRFSSVRIAMMPKRTTRRITMTIRWVNTCEESLKSCS
jgi:hypothetical protein